MKSGDRTVATVTSAIHVLCKLSDLADPGTRAFSVGEGAWPLRGFLVRRGAEIFGYVNRCPHAGHPLNFLPDQFLSRDRTLIQCSSHGALFAIGSGACVAGPCVGKMLSALPVHVGSSGEVILTGDLEELARLYA